MDVFLSYPNTEKPLAEALRRKLEDAGLGVFVDTASLAPGKEWQRELEKGVESAKLFLVLIDPERPPSRWQQAEWQAALETVWKDPSKRLVPVLPRGAEVPAFARSASGGRDVRALRLDDENDLDSIVRAAKELIDGPRFDAHRERTSRSSQSLGGEDPDTGGGGRMPAFGGLGSPDATRTSDRGATYARRDREERRERLAEIRRFAEELKK